MADRGKFIALEGIDGSGKRTQLELLAVELANRGIAHARISFPRYDSFFGSMVAQFLNGEFGTLDKVDPHFSALLYAGDRLESKPELLAHLIGGTTILSDRYVGSNLAHQTARMPREHREEFLSWLKKLEYGVYGLPVEDLVIYLRLPPAEAHHLVGKKAARDYTNLRRDLQENDLAHLAAASETYGILARQPNWATVECFDSAAQQLLEPSVIHRAVLTAMDSRIILAALPK
jgi:dTMP kinase